MSKIAIVYHSHHHHNTQRLVTSVSDVDVFDVQEVDDIDLSDYDLVGFASGIYAGKFHESITKIIIGHQPELRKVFLAYTSGSNNSRYGDEYKQNLEKIGLIVRGIFSCRGYNTWGPFRLVGGIAKGAPTEADLVQFRQFIEKLQNDTKDAKDGKKVPQTD